MSKNTDTNNIKSNTLDVKDPLLKKREQKDEVLSKMLKIYCRGNKHNKENGNILCDKCENLRLYAKKRTSVCPQIQNGLFCSKCPIQCYKPEMREEIRKCMRYSGPRLMLYHPGEVIKHIFQKSQKKK